LRDRAGAAAARAGGRRGFAYLLLLLWLAIGGAMLAALGTHWAFESRREREQEFVFRAEQYRHAIEGFAAPMNVNGCSNLRQFPEHLTDLLEDRRCGVVRHHLRALYADPVANSADWGLVVEFGGIRGVYSLSTAEPIRHVDGVKTYRDWRFLAAGASIEPLPPASAPAR
jgi:hypothetical protein